MLSDKKATNAKPRAKPYKLADRDGLYLYVSTSGARSWRFDYRHAGKRQTLTYGRFPEVGLAAARSVHAEARATLARGDNPATQKKRAKLQALAAGDFKSIAEAWYAEKVVPQSASWRANARRWLDLSYPYIGAARIKELGAAEVLGMLRELLKKKTPNTVEYVRKTVALVFDYAILNLKADTNPARYLRGAVEKPKTKGHAHISAKEIPAFLQAVDAGGAALRTRLATKALLLTFVRKNELLGAKWTELDLDAAKWEIPAERMKNRYPHIVPLAPQVVEIFKQLKTLSEGSEYIFPKLSDRRKPMSEATLNGFFWRIEYGEKATPHGFRATASTALNEAGFRPDVIERQLSHVERDQVRGAYNKADYLGERKELMEYWANLIDSLCAGGNVVPFRRGQAA